MILFLFDKNFSRQLLMFCTLLYCGLLQSIVQYSLTYQWDFLVPLTSSRFVFNGLKHQGRLPYCNKQSLK